MSNLSTLTIGDMTDTNGKRTALKVHKDQYTNHKYCKS